MIWVAGVTSQEQTTMAAIATEVREQRLPSPQDRPEGAVVLYDGECRMCTTQVRRLGWFDTRGHLAYLSLHDPEVARRYPDLSHEELMRAMVIVSPDGKRHVGADAFRYLSRKLPRLWWLAPLLHIPGSLGIWQWLYRQVANRRYLFGKMENCTDEACQIHLRPR
jgi:predicted DCC family thiol-disulfide oxidoreductase YuxK